MQTRIKKMIGLNKRESHLDLYIMLLPGVVMAFIFCYLPIYGVQLAFREYNFVGNYLGGEWVGFKYFQQFLKIPTSPDLFAIHCC